jgi:hypothetical protein
MPNWCANELEITAPNEVIKEVAATGLSLQKIFPCPEELLNTTAPAEFNDKDKYDSNIKKYGHPDWYTWQVANWGTKWDITLNSDLEPEENEDGTSTIRAGFDSAWGPPVEAFQKLYEKYKAKNIYIRLEYFEPGCAFLGVAKTVDGDFVDDCREYETADELEAYVTELDHCLAEYEVEYLRDREEEEAADLEEKNKTTAVKAVKPLKKQAKKKAKTASKKVTKPSKKAVKKPAKKIVKTAAKKTK